MLDLTFLYRSNILAPMMYFFSIREFSGFLFPNNLYYKISFNISQVNEMWKIHVRYDSNSSLCLIYKKKRVERHKCASMNKACRRQKLQQAKHLFTETKISMKFLCKLADKIWKNISFNCSYSILSHFIPGSIGHTKL